MATPTVYTPKRLADPQQLPTTTGTLYTSPAGKAGTQVTSLKLVNTASAPVTATVYVVESGGSAADNRALCKDFSVPADGLPYELLEGAEAQFYLNAGDTIRGVAGSASSITVHLSGVELE
jgi:hypothetical protein